ncbi:MAG: AAA family ATPase [Candidatus Sungbacteria bacterium]|nr:AAA family ATPase [Candidatus Sungbacteria bacterium]
MTQHEALEIMKMGRSVFLTGAAGSGKTFLLNEYIRFLRAHAIPVAVTASTGIAATHMNGITLHSWAGFGVRESLNPDDIRSIAKKRRYAARFASTQVLIIDEVSMLHAHHLDMTDQILQVAREPWKPFGGLQVILCGDFFQLPPVNRKGDSSTRFAYESHAWRSLDPTICYLAEQHRHEDTTLLQLLNHIRSNSVTEDTRVPLRSRWRQAIEGAANPTKLFAHNADADLLNAKELKRIPGEPVTYSMVSHGPKPLVTALKQGCLAPEELALKKNAMVMFVKNNRERGYVNGTMGRVAEFDAETSYPLVETKQGRRVLAAPAEWKIEEQGKTQAAIAQVPLRLAWAITVHKSQGMTLDAAEIDLSGTFEKGMGYVALSRVRTLAGLKLTGMNELAFQVSEKILELDCEFRAQSRAAQQELTACSQEEKDVKQTEFLVSVGVRNAASKPVSKNRQSADSAKSYSVDEIRKSHPAAYLPWTLDEEKRLKELFVAGMPIVELARMHGRKQGSILARLIKLGLRN